MIPFKGSKMQALPDYASVNSSCAQSPLPPLQADPRALPFVLPWMANSQGWGLLSCQISRAGDEKEGKCPVLCQLAQSNSAI